MSETVKVRVLPSIGKNGSIHVPDQGAAYAGQTFTTSRKVADQLISEGWVEEVPTIRERLTGRAKA
jgi:hypothetical protein